MGSLDDQSRPEVIEGSVESNTVDEDPPALFEGAEEGDLNASSSGINLEKADRSLSEFKRWFDEGDLVLDPEWQRNYVWDRKRASKLIESFLLSIPVPVVYLSRTQDQQYEVIDGLQRLKTIFDFLSGEFALTGLDVMKELNGKRFQNLDRGHQRSLKNSTLRSFELSSKTDPNIHFLVFERLNTGSTKLNEMEIRNCIFRGKMNDLIRDLAKNRDFVACLGQSSRASLQKRMNDRALVLRFLAFYERTHSRCQNGLKKFLNEFLETYRNPPEAKLREYTQKFEHCIRLSKTVFGTHAFRLRTDPASGSRTGEWATRINASVFQCISTSFAEYDAGQITRAADRIREGYLDLVTSDRDWIDRVRRATGERTRLAYVFDTWKRRLRDCVGNSEPNDPQRAFSWELKQEMYRQSQICVICENKIELIDDAAMDHEKHYWRGGKTIPENARLVHRYCNLSRGSS